MDLDRGLDHTRFVDHPPSIETYVGPDGTVIVLDGLSSDLSLPQAEALREEGFQLQDSGPMNHGGIGNQTEGGWNLSPVPTGDDNLRDSTSDTGRNDDRDNGVTVIVTTGESSATTGDYTTTTTGDYTTTTTGDYTTTTTGDYTTTTTGDYTTTTTGDY
ncbi:MAG: hypothetical protein IPK68_16220 [Bdellovibrionales bacterium]|nr:hypothetical protein [Bdellovibrionales bacterium]